MKLADLKDKKILILGLGVEGLSTYKYLRKKYHTQLIGLSDQNEYEKLNPDFKKAANGDLNIKWHLGKSYQDATSLYDVTIKSPGIIVKNFQGQKITSQTELFLNEFKDKVIGVTGSKGKSTTSSLLYKILKDAKESAELIGNIGKPPLDAIDTNAKYYVFELSSYQLQNLKVSPHIAVFLNLFPEHLDYHGSFKTYAQAKENIFKWQDKDDFLIYNGNSEEVLKLTKEAKAQKLPFNTKKKSEQFSTNLKGKFNLNNILAAVTVAKLLNIKEETVAKSVKSFMPLKHRLQYVRTHNGIDFYNDSVATIPEATIAALETLSPKVGTLIIGGLDRGVNLEKLAEMISKEKIKNLILFPQTGKIILEEIKKQKKHSPKYFFVKDMKKAVQIASEVTKSHEICLLSPAAASYNIFKNFEDRGEQFIQSVNNLK